MAHHKKEEHHKKHREEREKFARGGRSKTGVEAHSSQNHNNIGKEDDYTGSGRSEVVKNAKDTTDEFKCGGKVDGKKAKHHAGKHKFARGGRAKGGSPFSSAYVHGIRGDAK